MNIRALSWWALLLLGGGIWWAAGCGESRQPYAGTYRSIKPYADKGHVELVLKDTGEGTWKLEQEGTAHRFKWRVDQGRLFLYLKEGTIIIVIPSKDGKILTADLTGEWNPSCPVEDNAKCIIFQRGG